MSYTHCSHVSNVDECAPYCPWLGASDCSLKGRSCFGCQPFHYLILSLSTSRATKTSVDYIYYYAIHGTSVKPNLVAFWRTHCTSAAQRKLRVCVSHDHSWLIPPTKLDSIVVVSSLYIHIIYSLLRTQQWNKLKRPSFRMLAVYQSGLMPLQNWIVLQWLCSDQAVHFPIGDSDDDDSRSPLYCQLPYSLMKHRFFWLRCQRTGMSARSDGARTQLCSYSFHLPFVGPLLSLCSLNRFEGKKNTMLGYTKSFCIDQKRTTAAHCSSCWYILLI